MNSLSLTASLLRSTTSTAPAAMRTSLQQNVSNATRWGGKRIKLKFIMIAGDLCGRGDLQERAMAQGVLHLHQLHKVGRLNNPIMEIVETLEF